MDNITFLLDDFNVSSSETYRRQLPMRILGSSFTFCSGVMSVLGNLAVILGYFWDETLRKETGNMFIVSLSITDAITGLFAALPLSVAIAYDSWPFGEALCKLHNGIYYSCTSSSSLNVLLISVDRVIAVKRPLRYHDIMNTERALSLCAILFCSGACVMIGVLVFDFSRYHYSEGSCVFASEIYESRFMSIPSVFTYYFVSAVGIGICNSLIALEAARKKKNKLFTRINSKDTNSSRLNKTVLSMVAVAVVFYVTTLPYALAVMIDVFSDVGVPWRLNYFFSVMTYVSPVVNPFIYGFLRKDYRNAYKNFPRTLVRKIRGAR